MNKKLSIIVPVYNEVKTILIILNKLKKLNLPNNYKSEIIIVDDNSSDGTVELLKKFKLENSDVKVIYKPENKGKGHSQKIAKGLGYKAMQFNLVLVSNKQAVSLWTKLGFDTVGKIPKAFDHPKIGYVDALVMHKWL